MGSLKRKPQRLSNESKMRVLPQGQDSAAWKGDGCPGAVYFLGKLKVQSPSLSTQRQTNKDHQKHKMELMQKTKKVGPKCWPAV